MTFAKFSRYATAHTAQSRADAGEFSCMGRVLRPLSLFHAELLKEALGDDFVFLDDLADFALLEIATKICSEEKPCLDLGIPETDEEFEAFRVKCEAFDLDKESERFGRYVQACYLSGPRLRDVKSSGTPKELNAPYPHIVISQLLRMTKGGISYDDLLYRWPVSQVLWLYWSLRELDDDVSHIAETEEPIEKTAEEIEAENRITNLVGTAIARQQKKSAGIVDDAMLAEIQRETDELIKRIEAGELTEVPA